DSAEHQSDPANPSALPSVHTSESFGSTGRAANGEQRASSGDRSVAAPRSGQQWERGKIRADLVRSVWVHSHRVRGKRNEYHYTARDRMSDRWPSTEDFGARARARGTPTNYDTNTTDRDMAIDPTRSVIDADGHVLEPADTWLKYLDPI